MDVNGATWNMMMIVHKHSQNWTQTRHLMQLIYIYRTLFLLAAVALAATADHNLGNSGWIRTLESREGGLIHSGIRRQRLKIYSKQEMKRWLQDLPYSSFERGPRLILLFVKDKIVIIPTGLMSSRPQGPQVKWGIRAGDARPDIHKKAVSPGHTPPLGFG
ncbi:hypothetical protein BD779DRAFT_1472162 [Infundibulicybe gibba]|nr:hypothetical protein BD779DRAFT_1472162 [Infundibulicybe gibba]